MIQNIVQWIKNYCNENEIHSLIVGVSGGIDSAVTSTLCALTGLPTFAIGMPLHQNLEQENLSDAHLKWLTKHSNVQIEKINLTEVYDSFISTMQKNIGDIAYNDLASANTKSRLRMITLYHLAQIHSGIVVGTGNKVEDFGVGFFTKYGDGGVDIAPIAHLFKSQVYDIAKELQIDKRIIKAKPTDGLWEDGRTDEEQMEASYDELEWAMEYSGSEDDLTDRQRIVLDIYNKYHQKNLHKMKPIPVIKYD